MYESGYISLAIDGAFRGVIAYRDIPLVRCIARFLADPQAIYLKIQDGERTIELAKIYTRARIVARKELT